jgi:signal peptidase I
VVEAFVIPTGSMAPTLMGAHARVVCSQCGYTYTINWPYTPIDTKTGERVPQPLPNKPESQGVPVVCPMCHWQEELPKGANPSAGDRILVHKFIYDICEPRRWDVVVFKNPREPDVNFIKRLVGLPGEEVGIVEGNIYVRPIDAGDDPRAWRIARKTERPNVQRAVWQPIYHSDYFPLDGGQSPIEPTRLRWQMPWRAVEPGAGESDWRLPGPDTPPGPDRTHYRYGSAEPGALRFDLHSQLRDATHYAYNQIGDGPWDEPLEDVRLAVRLRPDQAGLAVTLRTEARLDNPGNDPEAGVETLAARIDADGTVSLLRGPAAGDRGSPDAAAYQTIKTAKLPPLPPGRTTTIELWFADQHALVWVDDELVLDWAFELDFQAVVVPRPPLQAEDFPHVAVEVAGSPVTFYDVELDRDIYYSTYSRNEPEHNLARGGVHKQATWHLAPPGGDGWLHGPPVRLNPGAPGSRRNDEFFCLGDNSPSSSDSRYWGQPDPWIDHHMFDGLGRQGVVPRHLMMGRAFFVYFPAPFRWNHQNRAVFINFGDMRLID